MTQAQITLDRSTFTIGAGTKGARREMTFNLNLDVEDLPSNVATAIFQWGAERLLQQASQSAERAQVSEWQERNEGKEPPPAARFPWDLPRLERDIEAAMRQRLDEWKAGEVGRTATFMSALDRRATSIAELRVRKALASAKREATSENVANGVALLLSHAKYGPDIRAEAERQLAAEREAARAPLGDDILAAIGA